jgi:hypothetical protein
MKDRREAPPMPDPDERDVAMAAFLETVDPHGPSSPARVHPEEFNRWGVYLHLSPELASLREHPKDIKAFMLQMLPHLRPFVDAWPGRTSTTDTDAVCRSFYMYLLGRNHKRPEPSWQHFHGRTSYALWFVICFLNFLQEKIMPPDVQIAGISSTSFPAALTPSAVSTEHSAPAPSDNVRPFKAKALNSPAKAELNPFNSFPMNSRDRR